MVWKIAKWARLHSHQAKDLPQFPPLKRQGGEGTAHEFDEKVAILRDRFFPAPPEAELSDIAETVYPESTVQSPEMTADEVAAAIRRPKAHKAPGVSQIPNLILQTGLPKLLPYLHCLFNACARQAYHPRLYRLANTLVLRKPGKKDYTEAKAYRPIALLDTVGKALESIIATRLSKLAEEHNMLPACQMGARRGRSTETALELLVEQIHTVWGEGNNHVASILSLDISGAFNNVSHTRLLHNLRKRKVPEYIIKWTESFLKDRQSSLSFDGQTSEMRPVNAGIPQGSPVSPILFLFFNADLFDECDRLGLKASSIGFVDDANILAYGRSTEDNCETLAKIHEVCILWARQHGATFAPEKYELIHLSRTPRRFNMTATLRTSGVEVSPKQDIRILGVQIDTKLRWGAHLRKIEAKNATQMLAMTRLGASTWGATFAKARQIYCMVVRPAMTYGASVWHKRGDGGKLAGKERRLELLQNKGLRNITGAFKRTSTASLEAEAFVPPISIQLNKLQDQATHRMLHNDRVTLIEHSCNTIRAKLASRSTHPTPLTMKKQLLAEAVASGTPPPQYRRDGSSTTPPSPMMAIAAYHKNKWKERWDDYRNGRTTQTPTQRTPLDGSTRQLRRSMPKAESTLATHIRTERIGLRAYLHANKVPDHDSPACECGHTSQTAKHVLIHCPTWTTLRQRLRDDMGEPGPLDYRRITGTARGLRAAARMLMETNLLAQFAVARTLLYGSL